MNAGMQTLKRVLVIAYHFPPLGTGGVGRALGWARHLQEFEWCPTVLASTPGPGWPGDATLLNQIPESISVTRVPAWDLRPARMRGFGHRELTILWRQPGLREGRRILMQTKHDLILSTAPPPVAHGVAAVLAREFKIPWIADFRDPWALGAPTMWRRYRRTQLVKSAADVIAVNDDLGAHLEASFRRPVHTVFNGYEPDEIPTRSERLPGRAILLGTLSDFNDFNMLFKVLAEAGGEFVHIGTSRRYDLAAKAAAAGLNRVHSTGYLSRRDALRELAKGSVMLLSLAPEENLTLPTKVFDYIGIGGPVLCLGDRGATADFVKQIPGLGLSVPPGDESAIRSALEKLWSGKPRVAEEHRLKFTRAYQIERLVRVMNSAVEDES